jgi:hypothetical protein
MKKDRSFETMKKELAAGEAGVVPATVRSSVMHYFKRS